MPPCLYSRNKQLELGAIIVFLLDDMAVSEGINAGGYI